MAAPVCHATPCLNTTLIQAAWVAIHKKGRYLKAQFLGVKNCRVRRKPSSRSGTAVPIAAYFNPPDWWEYHTLGGRYFVERDTNNTSATIRRLRDLGFVVEVKSA